MIRDHPTAPARDGYAHTCMLLLYLGTGSITCIACAKQERGNVVARPTKGRGSEVAK